METVLSLNFYVDRLRYLVIGAFMLMQVPSSLKAATAPEALRYVQQSQNITGTVKGNNGETLPGVSILVKGTSTGAVTDVEGNYRINVPSDDDILVFSSIGYTTKEVPVNGQSVINVILAEDVQSLDEVVVIGYGTQKKVDLTGAVTTVNAEFLESRPITNSSQALQGMQGVYVNQVGGQPGEDDATIRIRGVGTLNNNDPLVLVNGVEFSLRDVNPNDIESISVLKDAASAAIYGSRAANGVILITTKTGEEGKLKVEYNGYYGLQQATYLPDMITNSVDYMMARNQASINEGQPPVFTDAEVEEYRNGTDPDIYPHTDWWDIMFSVAPIQDNYLRFSGATESVSYSTSLGYLRQDGVMMGTDADKYSFNSSVSFNVSKKLTVGANIQGTYWNRNQSAYDDASGEMGNLARALPMHPNILSDGRYGDTWKPTPGHNIFRHPVARATEGLGNLKTQRAMIKLSAEYVLPFNILYNANFGLNKYDANEHRFIPEVFVYDPKKPDVPRVLGKEDRSVRRSNHSNLHTTFYHTLNWTKNIAGQHHFNLLLGNSIEKFYNSNFNGYIEGFLDNELTELNAGSLNKDIGGTSNVSRLMSFFGRANYRFSEKYLLDVNFRFDGSSRFAKQNRWGFFPSFAAAWRISKESFMSHIDAVTNLKLRFSWGRLGNQNIPLYSYANTININQGTNFNNQVAPGSAVTTLSDPNISWETTTITNIGLDLGLWNNTDIIVEVFDKVTSDILDRINVPGQVGDLTGPITNLFGMSNKGIEVSASHTKNIGDLRYRIGANIAYVNNTVDYLAGEVHYINPNTYGIRDNIGIIKEGYPVNSWYLFEAVGIFQSQEEIDNSAFQHQNTAPGDLKYRDVNNDGTIDADDKQIKGRSVPKFTYGFNMDFDYKGFDFSAFFQGVQDIDIYTGHNVGYPLFNGAGITRDVYENHWTPENPDAKYPRLFLALRGYGGNAENSTFWLHDASYLRLKNLQLGYTIPYELTSRININKLRVYLNAQNALTFSKYKVTDPEKNIFRQSIFDYPTTKIFSIGCSVTF